jgi:predicted hydrolase (HD superfamily)
VTRFEAFLLLRKRIRDRSLIKNCLAVEAIMEDLAVHFGEEPQTWGLAGLLHEMDNEFTENNPGAKGKIAAEIARNEGAPDVICRALGKFRQPGPFDDLLTNSLAVAVPAAMVVFDLANSAQVLSQLTGKQMSNAFDDPSVAPAASRTRICYLVKSGVDLARLLEIARLAVLRVASDVFDQDPA